MPGEALFGFGHDCHVAGCSAFVSDSVKRVGKREPNRADEQSVKKLLESRLFEAK